MALFSQKPKSLHYLFFEFTWEAEFSLNKTNRLKSDSFDHQFLVEDDYFARMRFHHLGTLLEDLGDLADLELVHLFEQ